MEELRPSGTLSGVVLEVNEGASVPAQNFDIILWPFDERAAEEFGRIQAEQKAKGRPIPPLDAQIAAVARVHGLVLLTADHHFTFVDGIAVENWLEPL